MPDSAIPALLQSYLEELVPDRAPELRAMEALAEAEGFPIIGPACGQVCYLVARMIGARRIFELGSGFGYSTAWLARAVRENAEAALQARAAGAESGSGADVETWGEVHHTVWDRRLSEQARRHLTALGLDGCVRFHCAEAVSALRAADGRFDLIFSDIDKEGYPDSLPVVEQRLRPGGALIVDNMLWGNRIFDPADRDAATEGVRRFTRMVAASSRWIGSILPIRDGLLLAMRR